MVIIYESQFAAYQTFLFHSKVLSEALGKKILESVPVNVICSKNPENGVCVSLAGGSVSRFILRQQKLRAEKKQRSKSEDTTSLCPSLLEENQ